MLDADLGGQITFVVADDAAHSHMVQRCPAGSAGIGAAQAAPSRVSAHIDGAAAGIPAGGLHGSDQSRYLRMQACAVLVPSCLERMRLDTVMALGDDLVLLHDHAAHSVPVAGALPADLLGQAEESIVSICQLALGRSG